MDRQQRAIIQIECQQLLNHATMLIDEERWEELSNCYTEDGVLYRPSDSKTGVVGRANILDSFKSRPPRTSCHVLANSFFEITSPTRVNAKSRIWLVTGETSESFPVSADSKLMIGTFADTLVRVNDEWLIESRKGSIELKYSYE